MVRQYQLVESRARKRQVPESVPWKTGEAAPASQLNRTGATRFVMDVNNASMRSSGVRCPAAALLLTTESSQ